MNDFILDLWQDLREQRLWPVAAALLLALVAVPFVLVKPAKEAPAQPSQSAATQSSKQLLPIDGKALLEPADESVSNGSALKAFLSKNPFKPIRELRAEAGVSPTTVTSAGSAATTAGASPTGISGGVAGGGKPSGTPSVGGTPSTGGVTKTVTAYTYTANLHFGLSGHEKRYRAVHQLSAIPDDRTPLLVFLGVTSDHKKAVFLMDTKLETSGEGRCKPSASKCTFLYLAQDSSNNEQLFTDVDGTEYTLSLDRLNKEVLGRDSSGGSGAGGKKPAHGSAFSGTVRSFGFPLFSHEEITVQTNAPGSSGLVGGR